MKTIQQLKPNYAPVYAASLYPKLCEIVHKHGYALAVHGSLARDFDLIAVPWVAVPSCPADVIKEITTVFAISVIGLPTVRAHNRLVYSIAICFSTCALDFSFMPVLKRKVVKYDKPGPDSTIRYKHVV